MVLNTRILCSENFASKMCSHHLYTLEIVKYRYQIKLKDESQSIMKNSANQNQIMC